MQKSRHNKMETQTTLPIEHHPFEPFVPDNARILFLGTFPPQQKRWAMNFYYPNRTNDFWRIMGLIFEGDAEAYVDRPNRTYRLDAIKAMLYRYGIAMSDTAHAVRRLRDNASDKYLEIVEPVDLEALRRRMPGLRAIVSTGEKAADTVASLTGTERPGMGRMTTTDDGVDLWRLPSTSRAYPLALEKKAEYYAAMFRHELSDVHFKFHKQPSQKS